jgi:hypothetical protein
MVGLERFISWLSALLSNGSRAGAPSALDPPVANDLVAVEKRQDKQQGKSIGFGRKAYLYFWVPIIS